MGLRWLLAAFVLLPSAQACSLLYVPFEDPTWQDSLHFVSGSSLRRVDGFAESELETGFFLSYAEVGGRLLVAGQDGLGADCSGDGFLRLYDGERLVWEREGTSHVWPHEDGPFVRFGEDYFRLDGDALVPYAADDRDEYVIGWTHDGKPAFRHDGKLVLGGLEVTMGNLWDEATLARNGATTAFLVTDRAGPQDHAELWVLDGDAWQVTRWNFPEPEGYWPASLAWVDGWVATVAGRAYRVDGEVTDLGVVGVAVARHGDSAVVFQEDGYTVFHGTTALEARERRNGFWLPRQVEADPRDVESSSERVPVREGSGGPNGPTSTSRGSPAPPFLALAALAAAGLLAAGRRR